MGASFWNLHSYPCNSGGTGQYATQTNGPQSGLWITTKILYEKYVFYIMIRRVDADPLSYLSY